MRRLGEGGESCGQTLSCLPFGDLLGVVNDGDDGDNKFNHFALALLATFNNAEGLLEEVAVCGISDDDEFSSCIPGSVVGLELKEVIIDEASEAPSTSSSSVSSKSLSSSSASLADRLSAVSNRFILGVCRLERFEVRSTSYLKVGGKSMCPSLKPLKIVLSFIRTLSWSNSSA